MSERATIFGEDAEAYDRFRPGYPDSIVDLVAAHADGPVSQALEIGAGTGKATMVFAAAGIRVVAVEPDPRMSAVLEARADDLPVEIVNSTFEALDLDAIGRVDLLFAASAFHWTSPQTRWDRTAALVRPGGVAAMFGATVEIADERLSDQVDEISESVLGVDPFDPGAIGDKDGWPASDLRQRQEFTDVVETAIPISARQSATDFVAHLSTVSAYRVLTPTRRDAVLSRIEAALPEFVDVTQDVSVHMARRR